MHHYSFFTSLLAWTILSAVSVDCSAGGFLQLHNVTATTSSANETLSSGFYASPQVSATDLGRNASIIAEGQTLMSVTEHSHAATSGVSTITAKQHVPHSVPQRKAARVLHQEAIVDDEPPETSAACSLPRRSVDVYLNQTTRVWLLDQTVLNDIEDDVQVIIDCTRPGDILLFDTQRRIRPSSSIVLRWPLTLSAYVDEAEFEKGDIPRSKKKAAFTCPDTTQGIFSVRSESVVFANLKIKGCSLNASAAFGAIFEAEECPPSNRTSSIQLHHVSFRKNVLNDAACLKMRSPSCSALTLIDVQFVNNSCSGRCGVVLAAENRLEDVHVDSTHLSDIDRVQSNVFYGPRGSQINVTRMVATHNEAEIFRVEGGSLTLIESELSSSEATTAANHTRQTGIYLKDSAARIENCKFRNNKGENGAVLFAVRSVVNISASSFESNVAKRGGALCLSEDTSASISNCTFLSNAASDGDVSGGGCLWCEDGTLVVANTTMEKCSTSGAGGAMVLHHTVMMLSDLEISSSRAGEDGGGIFMADSFVTGTRLTLSDNKAGDEGGGICMEDKSRISVTTGTMRNNSARSGGAVCARTDVSSSFRNIRFLENAAMENGGSFRLYGSTMDVKNCTFESGRAEHGGFIAARDNAAMSISRSTFKNGTAQYGGCVHIQLGNCTFMDVDFRKCRSIIDGGVMRIANATVAITNAAMISNRADDDGGCVFAEFSDVSGRQWIVDDNSAGDHAGAVLTRFFSNFSLINATFNRSSADNGGVVFSESNSTVRFVNVSFQNSDVVTEGGSLYIDASNATFRDCRFEKSRAENGGFIYAKRDSSMTIDATEMTRGDGDRGGCLRMVGGHLVVLNSTFQYCRSSDDGGALHLIDLTADISNSNLSLNLALSGGAVFAEHVKLAGSGLVVEDNKADGVGGALRCAQSTISVKNTRFQNNTATNGGAVHQIASAIGTFVNVTFSQNNCSENGGSLFVSGSELNMARAEFEDGRAEKAGAFIATASNSSVILKDVHMRGGQADNGGGVLITDSSFEASKMQILDCVAASSGGAFRSENNPTVACTDCKFEGNVAATHGGAFSFKSSNCQRHEFRLQSCLIRNNTAQYGGTDSHMISGRGIFFAGGLHLMDNRQALACPDTLSHSPSTILVDSNFSNNRAEEAGGAVFVSDFQNLHIKCPSAQKATTRVGTKRSSPSPPSINRTNGGCSSWTDNKAELYGNDMASFASHVVGSVEIDNSSIAISERDDDYTIEDYRSGSTFPIITLRAEDDLGQAPAIGRDSRAIASTVSSPDHLFTENQSLLLSSESVELRKTEFARPGVYTILFEFDEGHLNSFRLKVIVQSCGINEVPSGNGTFCEACSAAAFNFRREEDADCSPCPADANCETRVILPNKGHWHQTPCSKHIQRCIASEACDKEERMGHLKNVTKGIESCDFDEEMVKNYTNAQCEEGHEGPLCGSCKESYGRSRSHLCQKCFPRFVSLVLVFLFFLVLMALSGITIRSNLLSVVSKKQQLQIHQLSVLSSKMIRLPDEEKIIEMAVQEQASEERQRPESSQTHDIDGQSSEEGDQTSEEVELAKWKAIEVFKIGVNFLQVTAIAIAVNVNWSLSMETLFEAAEFMSGISSEAVTRAIDCLVPANAAVERTIISALVDASHPLAAIFSFAAGWLIIKFRRGKDWMYLMKKVVLSALVVLYMTYISLSKAFLNILSCIEVHDSIVVGKDRKTDYWSLDTSVECYTGSHALLVGLVGWPLLIVFTFGFPMAIGYLIIKNVEEDYKAGWIYDVSGFLYRSYRKKFVFWESMIMLRKAVLAVVVVFSYPLGVHLQQILAVFLLILALYLQTVLRPYRFEFDVLNDIESASILVSLVTFVSAIFFSEDRVSSAVRVLVTLSVIFCNVGLFLFICIVFLIFAARYLTTVLIREEVAYNPSLGDFHVLRVYLFHYLLGEVRKKLRHYFVS